MRIKCYTSTDPDEYVDPMEFHGIVGGIGQFGVTPCIKDGVGGVGGVRRVGVIEGVSVGLIVTGSGVAVGFSVDTACAIVGITVGIAG